MKRYKTVLIFTLILAFGSCQKSLEKEDLKTSSDKISYSLGALVGKSYQRQSIVIDNELFSKGMRDGLKGESLYQDKELYQIVREYHNKKRTGISGDKKVKDTDKKSQADYEKEKAITAEKNLKEGIAFLKKNKLVEGVITTDSGLQYRVLEKGTGEVPRENDSVIVEYEGKLINGKIFDSSKRRKNATVFPVNGTIAGMKEALLKMPVGSKWDLYIPAVLAYGEKGAGHAIGPNAMIIFKLKLLGIQSVETD